MRPRIFFAKYNPHLEERFVQKTHEEGNFNIQMFKYNYIFSPEFKNFYFCLF